MTAPGAARDALFQLEDELLYVRGVYSCLMIIASSPALGEGHAEEALHYLAGRLAEHHGDALKAYGEIFAEAVKVLSP